MIAVTLKGLAGRKLRASLTALAIVLGVAMVSGTYVLTDTISKGFDAIFADTYTHADADRRPGRFGNEEEARPPATQPTLLTRCGAVAGRGRRGGPRRRSALGEDGQVIETRGDRGAHRRPRRRPRVQPARPREGQLAARGRARSRSTARPRTSRAWSRRLDRRRALGPVQRFHISGIAEYGSVDSLGGATLAAFELGTAQTLFDKAGSSTRSRSRREGVSTGS